MKKVVSLLIIVFMSVGLFSCMPNLQKFVIEFAAPKVEITEEVEQDAKFDAFLDKINEFSISVSASILSSAGANDNLCISPASIYMSLAVASECASGLTRQEILDAVGVSYDEMKEYTKYYYALFNKEYTYVDTYGAEHVSAHEQLATSLWIDSDQRYYKSCVDTLSKDYNCDVYSISFKNGTAKKLINQYIPYKMHNIVDGDADISSSADLSIISLYHLKEIWNEFGRKLTLSLENYSFVNADKSSVEKQLLKSGYASGRVYISLQYTAFCIETEHGYRLYFMIPNNSYTLNEVFTPKNIFKMFNRREYGFVDDVNEQLHYTRLLFPQMNVSFSGDISNNLKNDFNINSLFSEENCDLSGLLWTPAHCNSFIHKAKLSLDAKGIEGETIDLGQADVKDDDLPNYERVYHEYVIDRAFGFVLTDADGLILYTGQLNTLK